MSLLRRRLRRCAFRVIAVALGLLLASGAAEVVLRLTGWPTPGLYDEHGNGPVPLRRPGPAGGAYPAGPGRLRHYDYDVEWSVNRDGFREVEPVPSTAGERRVGLLGDSFAAGVGVDPGDRFGDVWFRESGRADRGETLWNLASPWCGTAQSAAILGMFGSRYELDEVVLAFYSGNDLEDNANWYARDRIEPGPRSTRGLRDWLREHSRLATFLWVHGLRGLATFRAPAIHSRSAVEALWPQTVRALDEFLAAADGRPLTIWYLPSVAEWDDELWREIVDGGEIEDPVRSRPLDLLRVWCEERGIPLLDATESLAGRSADQILFPVDPHWNAEGHRIVGEGLAGRAR